MVFTDSVCYNAATVEECELGFSHNAIDDATAAIARAMWPMLQTLYTFSHMSYDSRYSATNIMALILRQTP